MRAFFGLLLAVAACGHDAASDTKSNDDTSAAPPTTTIASFPGSKIYKPAHLPAPALVLLHGSEGGSDPAIGYLAQGMAHSGFLVMTLCWFDCPGLPSKIDHIPLEQVISAGQWLEGTSDANGKVGLFGWSRGAEMALLVASKSNLDPYLAVAVHAPSDTVVGGFDPHAENTPPDYGDLFETTASGAKIPAASWTWQGQALYGEPDPTYDTPGPLIDVTAYKGPMYVSQGENDQTWSVSRGKHVVAERAAVPGLVTTSRFFPGEGHVLMKAADIEQQDADLLALFHGNLD